MGGNYSCNYQKIQRDQKQITIYQTAKFIAKKIILLISMLIAMELFKLIFQFDILGKTNREIDNPSIKIPIINALIPIILSIASYFMVFLSVAIKILSKLLNFNYQFIRLTTGGFIFFIINTFYQTRKLKYQTIFNLTMKKNAASSFVMTQVYLFTFLAVGWVLSFGDLQYLKENVIQNIYFHFLWSSLVIYCCWIFHTSANMTYPVVAFREYQSGKVVLSLRKKFGSYHQMEKFKKKQN